MRAAILPHSEATTTKPAKPTLLLGLRTSRVGGAERMVLEALPTLARHFRARVAALDTQGGAGVRLGAWSLADPRELWAGEHDILHTHLFLPGLIARLRRAFGARFRWVHTVHYHHYVGLSLPRVRQWLDRAWIFPATDALVAVSPAVYETVRHLPQAQLLDNAILMERVQEPSPPGSVPVIGTVAMLRREKGIDDLLRAMAELRDRGVDARLRIAGDGPMRGALEALRESLGLQDSIEFCGYVEDIDAFYRSLTVYAQPSIAEPFGLAALEALRYGRPVVGTTAGHLPTLLGDGAFGRLVPRSATLDRDLADAIAEVLSNQDTWAHRAEAGRVHWAERLDPKERTRRLMDIYREVLQPRVCFVAPIATHGGGGLQRQMELQSRALARRGHRVLVLQRHDPLLHTDADRRERWAHATVLETAALGAAGTPNRLLERTRGALFSVAALRKLWTARARFDVIYAQQLYSATLVGALAKRLLGKPLVVRVTATGVLGERRELLRLPFLRVRRWAFRGIDRVVTLTDTMASEMLSLGFERSRLVHVPNATEVQAEIPAEAQAQAQAEAEAQAEISRPAAERDHLRLLYVGRLSTEKSLETLVDAAGLAATSGERVEVRLVGRAAPQRDPTSDLRARADQLGPGARVIFAGPTDDVHAEYANADVFVLPSLSEGMSNALLEAMAHGLPCLVSDIPENRAVATDGVSAMCFPPGNASALAALIQEFARDARGDGALAARLGDGARARIAEAFGVDAVGARLSSLFDEVYTGS